MKKRAERAVDEPRRLVDDELAHVAFAEVELDAGRHSAFAGQCEHRGGKVDPGHAPTDCLRDGNGDTTVADTELDHSVLGFTCEPHVERDVRRHRGRPLLVPLSECLGPAHDRDRRCHVQETLRPAPNPLRAWSGVGQ